MAKVILNGLNRVRFLFALLTFTTGPLATFYLSAQPKAFATLKPDRIETGDTSSLLIIVSGLNTAPKEVDFSAWAKEFPSSNIIGRSDWRRNGGQWIRRFTLIAFDSASLELPPLYVKLGVGKPLETNSLKLYVFPTRGGREISDMAKIRDIYREPVSWLDYWPWGLGLLATLFCFFWWIRKNQRRPQPVAVPVAPAPMVISATEKALGQLAQLQQKQLWKAGKTKSHYAELSLIIREFLEAQFGISALESTTIEILRMLKIKDFPQGWQADLKDLLQKTDLVKYAQSQPEDAENEAVLAKAMELVSFNQSWNSEPPKIANPSKKTPYRPKTDNYEPL
ncbi:MAG: hypothetical protein ACKVT2_13665 [Saprospiraceae bacterium]